MNPPTTDEQLDALMQSTEFIRTAVEKARESREAEAAFGECYPVLKHQPLTRQVAHILSRLQRFRELMMENDKLKIDLAQARRENETLARQVPPGITITGHRTTGGTVANPEPVVTTAKTLGQTWCRTAKPCEHALELVSARDGKSGRVVLCDVHQDVTTGELTYEPISFDDLPHVTESPAS